MVLFCIKKSYGSPFEEYFLQWLYCTVFSAVKFWHLLLGGTAGSSKTYLHGTLFCLLICSDCKITFLIFVCFCYSRLKCENGQWVFVGWLVSCFVYGKEYTRNLKVMNIEGKKHTCRCGLNLSFRWIVMRNNEYF